MPQLYCRRYRVGAGLLSAILLAGCVHSPPQNAKQAPTSSVDMLVATTRVPSSDPDVVFTGERADDLSLANVIVSLPPGREIGTIQWPRGRSGDPRRDFVIESSTTLKRDQVRQWFSHAGNKRHVFVFVHGFNTQFRAAAFRFAQIAHDTDSGAAPVLFTWPSRGGVLNYNYDKESATFSRSDLAYVLRTAAENPAVADITLLAHSMGAWIAMEAVRQIALEDKGDLAKIDNIVLASPDIDVDVFRRQLDDIGPDRPLITVFTSVRDRALGISSIVAGGVARVGRVEVEDATYQKTFGEIPKLVFVDISRIRGETRLNHSTFATSPKIVQLIGRRLLAGQPMTDSDPVSPVDAVATLESAARTFVSTPFLILSAGSSQ